MISIVKSKMGIKIEEVWFSAQKSNDRNVDVIKYCQAPSAFALLENKSRTLITDLLESEDEILKKFNETTRRKIKEGVREGIITGIKFSDSLTIANIEEFVKAYHQFTTERGLSDFGDERKYILYLYQFCINGNLAISTAEVDGKIAVHHAHIHDERITRLLISFSHFRNDETMAPSLISRANCLLHYNDMLAFKNRGISVYDWGGISDKPDLQNITNFKKNFKGTETDTIYVKEGVSLKGKMAVVIEKIIKSVIRMN